jgi:Bifunctional DNA primase/polymerase, N-terminal
MMMLKYFDLYVKYGLKPIAVYRNSKQPIGKNWNDDWSPEKWRKYFVFNDEYNMGIILGDILDIEGDTEEANTIINNMTKNIIHPMFRSSKSIHHLFRSPDKNFRVWKFQGLEFRGCRHQSVVPPSKHQNGESYNWLKGSVLEVPEIPSELWQYYLCNRTIEKNKTQNKRTKKGYVKTECKNCFNMFFIHKKRLFLEVKAFQEKGKLWMCHGCRNLNIKNICRKIRKNIF